MDSCRNYAETWPAESDDISDGAWSTPADRQETALTSARKPIAIYSKRSTRLAELRSQITWLNARDAEETTPPTAAAIAAAENIINSLANDVLGYSCRIAISHDGEINFFFENATDLFQILILENGNLSYYAQNQQCELIDSEIEPADFPHLRLLTFLNHHQ